MTYTFYPEQLEMALNSRLKKQYNKFKTQKAKIPKIIETSVKIFRVERNVDQKQIQKDVESIRSLPIPVDIYKLNQDGLTFN